MILSRDVLRYTIATQAKKEKKDYISLPKSKKEINKLISSLGSVKEDDLCNAFKVLSDEVIHGVTKVKHGMITYLLKEVDGEYPVLNDYIFKFLCSYTKDKYWLNQRDK